MAPASPRLRRQLIGAQPDGDGVALDGAIEVFRLEAPARDGRGEREGFTQALFIEADHAITHVSTMRVEGQGSTHLLPFSFISRAFSGFFSWTSSSSNASSASPNSSQSSSTPFFTSCNKMEPDFISYAPFQSTRCRRCNPHLLGHFLHLRERHVLFYTHLDCTHVHAPQNTIS